MRLLWIWNEVLRAQCVELWHRTPASGRDALHLDLSEFASAHSSADQDVAVRLFLLARRAL